jgi:hypothetical protein
MDAGADIPVLARYGQTFVDSIIQEVDLSKIEPAE